MHLKVRLSFAMTSWTPSTLLYQLVLWASFALPSSSLTRKALLKVRRSPLGSANQT